jgi:molybdopterin converting factor small subunit
MPSLEIRLLGEYATHAGMNRIRIESESPMSVSDLVAEVRAYYASLANVLPSSLDAAGQETVMVLVNSEIARPDSQVKEGDQVVFVTPFGGG